MISLWLSSIYRNFFRIVEDWSWFTEWEVHCWFQQTNTDWVKPMHVWWMFYIIRISVNCVLESFLELITVTLYLTALFIEFFNNKKEFIDLFQLIFKLWYYICTCMNILNLFPLTNKLFVIRCLFTCHSSEDYGYRTLLHISTCIINMPVSKIYLDLLFPIPP